MNLDRFLEILAIFFWLLFVAYVVITFMRESRKYGFETALTKLVSFRVISLLALTIGISILSVALIFIPPEKVGVVISLNSPRGVREEPLRSGLRFIVPLLEEAVLYPIHWQTYSMSSKAYEGTVVGDDSVVARTSDSQEVILDTSIIFRLDAEQIVRIHVDWQGRYIEDYIRPTLRGIIRTEVSGFTVAEVNSAKRADLEAQLTRKVEAVLADKGIILDQFILRNITFSSEYARSVELKQVALEQVEERANQAEQIKNLAEGRAAEIATIAGAEAQAIRIRAEANATAVVLEADAQAEALRLIDAALQDNPNLLTYNYINKLAPNIQIMLLPNDTPLILPIPTMNAPTPAISPTPTPTPVTTTSSGVAVPTINPVPTLTPAAITTPVGAVTPPTPTP
mgnify:CR=1 FL=1